MLYWIAIPPDKRSLVDERTPGEIARRLRTAGYTVEWTTILTDGHVPLTLLVEGSPDPSADVLAYFATAIDRDAQARQVVRQTAVAIAAKDPGTRTAVERWMLAVTWLLFRDDGT